MAIAVVSDPADLMEMEAFGINQSLSRENNVDSYSYVRF